MKKTIIKKTSIAEKAKWITIFFVAGLGLLLLGGLLTPIIVGIPILIMGMVVFFGSPVLGYKMKTIECPNCQAKNLTVNTSSLKCKDCKKQILIRNGEAIIPS